MDDLGGEIQLDEEEKVQEQEEKARLITQVIFLWWISWLYCWAERKVFSVCSSCTVLTSDTTPPVSLIVP